MNQRIQELALKAGLREAVLLDHWGKIEALTDTEQDRLNAISYFAQLIALECARLAMTQHTSTSPADYDEMNPYDKGCDDTASSISGLIRRTFGVQE